MKSRSNVIFAGIFGLSLLATLLVFTIPHFMKEDPGPEGTLSTEVIKVESEFKGLQKEWKDNEEAFRAADPSISSRLTGIQERFKKLTLKVDGLKGVSRVEVEALPHLREAIKASARVPEPYVMRLMDPKRVGPKEWERMNADKTRANEEWEAWVKATGSLSR